MKARRASVAVGLFAGFLAVHVPAATAATDYGLVSGAGALGTSTVFSYDTSPVAVSGAGYSASAQTDFGLNRAVSGTTANTFAYAGSLWWDQYTITGGAGAGSTGFNAALGGNMASSGLAGAGVGYVLLVSETLPTFDFDFSTFNPTNTLGWLNTELGAFSAGSTVLASYVDGVFYGPDKTVAQAYAGNFDFTYGHAFYVTALLLTGAGGNSGTADFFNTATFNLLVNPGDVVTVASAVPEPGEWALLLAGLGLVAWRVRAGASRG